jgi:shikimate 5-dehydrogenase
MLVHQAALAFSVWTGQTVSTAAFERIIEEFQTKEATQQA